MFVGLYGHVAVFSRLASGNASPLRTLFGPPDMRLDSPVSAYVDPSHGEVGFGIYSRGGMLVFDRTASGTEAPLRVLNGDNFSFQSLALDEMNDELWAVSDLPWGVERYARTASGNAAPLRRLGTGGIAVALAINYPGAHIDKTFDPWDPYPDIWGPLLLSGTSTALYLPAKLGFAVIGGAVATPLSYLVSLGDAEVARLAWQTSTGGDYVVTPRMIQRGGPVRFLGPSE